MGSYLSTPVRDVEQEDFAAEDAKLQYGAAAMQGWRVSQEDAHVAQPEFDSNSMYYAVFDGHGGSEVAKYAAQHLGDHLKALQAYKEGRFEDALEEAFLTFDAALRDEPVQEILKAMAKEDASDNEAYASGTENQGEDDDEDLEGLLDDADMPLRDLVQRFGPEEIKRFIQKRIDMGTLLQRATSELEDDADDASENSEEKTSDEEQSEDDDEDSEDITSATAIVDEKQKDSKQKMVAKEKVDAEDQKPLANVKLDHLSDNDSVDNSALDVNNQVSKPDNHHSAHEHHHKPARSLAKLNDPTTSPPVQIEEAAIAKESHQSADGTRATRTRISVIASAPPAYRSCVIDDDQAGPSSTGDEPVAGSSREFASNSSPFPKENENEATDDDYKPDEIDSGSDDEEDEIDEDDLPPFLFPATFDRTAAQPGYGSGATACVALVNGQDLWVANVGDSRCVVSEAGTAIDMSHDHKPEDPEETERIRKAGGQVTPDGRVNSGLNLSRALGDHSYKRNEELSLAEQMISAKPDIQHLTLNEKHEFMVIACDGIWNSMSSQAVVDFVAKRLPANQGKVSNICKEMFNSVIAPTAGGDGTGMDNMTCIIIQFVRPKKPSVNGNHTLHEEPTLLVEPETNSANLKRPLIDDTTETNAEDAQNNENGSLKRMKVDHSEVENGVSVA